MIFKGETDLSLNKEFFNRDTNITAKVVCDSVSEQGVRLTTFEIEYPRFIHGELMTHRVLSKNSSSSRAIPIKKMLNQIESNMSMPVYWGKNKSGMQAVEEVSKFDEAKSVLNWERSFNYTKDRVLDMVELGLHKQVPNRLTEPFQMMKVVITGTDWDNFFNLRIHPDAQPEICMLAYKMYEAMEESKPKVLKSGEYHLPYVEKYDTPVCYSDVGGYEYETGYRVFYYDKEADHTCEQVLSLEEAIKLSAASCASVSYRTEGMTLEKAEKIFDMLIKAEVIHSSPFEHLATPVKISVCEFKDNDYVFADSEVDVNKSVNLTYDTRTWEKGITHVNKQGDLCSGNLRGWIQYRHLLPNNTCWKFDFKERMSLFS